MRNIFLLSESLRACVAAGCFHITISRFRIVRNAPAPKAFATLDSPLMRKRRVAPSFLIPLGGPDANAAGLGALLVAGVVWFRAAGALPH